MKRFIYLLIILFLLLASSCRRGIEQEQERYVVLSPEIAEILAALELTQRIVGLTDECTYPPALAEIEKVGAFGGVKLEKVLALKPTTVFTTALEQDAIAQDLRRLGYRVESLYPKNVNEIYSGILHLGELTDSGDKAQALVKEMQSQIASIRQQNQGKSVPKVYLEIYRDPLMSVADNSFVGELIELAGGDNVFNTLERDYSRVNPEAVIKAAPDIMICYSRDSRQNILSRKGWQNIPALKNDLIFFEDDIDPDLIQRGAPRIVQGIQRLSEIYELWRAKTGE
ncbi:MAG: cobalamin-binding protein [Candidatus Cloacimonetes bacterium]|nr:cobalamin-binding protein [Candidatus Cloacimonadota bacterium]